MGSKFIGDNTKYAGKKSDQGAPKPGTRYNPPKPDKTTGAATHSDNAYANKLIDRGGQFFTQR